MKGMYFIEMQDGKPVAQGRVGPQINQDYVFVHYDAPKKYARTVNMALFSQFALFQKLEDLNAFVTPPAPPPSVPAGTLDENKLDPDPSSGLE